MWCSSHRVDAIAAYIADLLVKDVYRQIRGTAKALLAGYSIDAAIAYKDAVTKHFQELVREKKYAKYAIVEVETGEPKARDPKETKIAEDRELFRTERQMSILEIVAARNQHQEQVGALIDEFKAKQDEFFAYVRSSPEGERLIVKMQSRLPEDEIYVDFAKIYRKYKAFNRKKVGDYFFAVMEEFVEKLCDEFEGDAMRQTAGT